MKHKTKIKSIKSEIAKTIILAVAFTIFLCWILNTVFLDNVYLRSKEDNMEDAYRIINAAAKNGSLYDERYRVTFEKICSTNNLSIMIISSDGTIELTSENETGMMLNQLYSMLFSDNTSDDYIIRATDNYSIESRRDHHMDEQYLVLGGTLSDSNLILMRTGIESIRDSANISNHFLLYVGIISVIISTFFSILLARKITKPVIELTEISRKMAELDFEQKYIPRHRKNEVDVLGIHMNELQDILEHNISDLKQANMDLQHDIEILDKNEMMRKEFLSNISHELKTPLALIQGYAEGLADGVTEDKESQQFYCEVIVDEANKMNRLVQEMLTLNQLEFGKDKFAMDHFDIVSLILDVVHANSLLMDKNNITLEFDSSKSVIVWADEFYTEQIVTNFLSNAIHYVLEPNTIRICVEETKTDVHISVFNTGNQIPEESIPYLWDKFYKVDKARTRAYGGSGIGLSVVKAIMENFKKKFGVINHENGVEFWFELDK